MARRLPGFLPFLFLLIWESLLSQPFTIHHYNIEDGLPSNYIFGVFQDSDGYLWIGTSNGLSRFDGSVFKNYNVKHGLPSPYIDQIYEDSKQRLWIGSRAGICELRGDSCYLTPPSDGRKISFVSQFVETEGDLVAMTSQGAYRYESGRWNKKVLVPGYENALLNGFVELNKHKYLNINNQLIAGTDSIGEWQILDHQPVQGAYFNSLRIWKNQILVGRYHGLDIWKNNQESSHRWDLPGKLVLYGIYIDRQERIWLNLGEKGIGLLNTPDPGLKHLEINLPVKNISKLLQDRDGQIWVASDAGLLRLQESVYEELPLSIENEGDIRRIMPLNDRFILISFESGKIAFFDIHTAAVNPLLHLQLPDADFADAYTMDTAMLWFTTRGGNAFGVPNKPGKNPAWVQFRHDDYFRQIAIDPIANRWLVAAPTVLLTGQETKLDTFFDAITGYPVRDIACIFTAKNGKSLLYSYEQGCMIIGHDQSCKQATKAVPLGQAEIGVQIREDQSGDLWISKAGSGIYRCRWSDDSLVLVDHLDDRNGLADLAVSDYCFDHSDRLWVLGNRQIAIFRVNQDNIVPIRFLDLPDEIDPTAREYCSLITDFAGQVWTFGPKSLFRFETQFQDKPLPLSSPVIEQILLHESEKKLVLFDSLQGYRQLPMGLSLPHSLHSLSFHYRGIELISGEQLIYSYRLLPLTQQWSEETNNTEIPFYQLPPDRYQFEVRVRRSSGRWSEPANYSFEIKQALWQTWWFQLLSVFTASGILLYLFYQRLLSERNRTKLKLQIRELEFNALKLQMNPHFIYNALNSIQSLIIQSKNLEAREYIQKFARLLRQVLLDSGKAKISLSEELSSVRLYFDLELLRMGKDIDWVKETDADVDIEDVRITPFVLQPFVENALWHGLINKKGERKITIGITRQKEWLIITVRDNGIGRPEAARLKGKYPEKHLSLAIQSITERLRLANQSPGVDPVVIRDLSRDDQSLGTQVEIRIRLNDETP